ncbi:hypothetical protein [Phyllobacterium sophorae]|uniref:hypothetical protein n=1 Tax=Phyllobacterium sophorae TaxID=1520277 RepID=UPI003CCA6A70
MTKINRDRWKNAAITTCRRELAYQSRYSVPNGHSCSLINVAPRAEKDALTSSQRMCLSVDHSGQFALNEVDGFIVLGVDVDRRLRVSAADVFKEAKLAIGLLAGAGASSPRWPKQSLSFLCCS